MNRETFSFLWNNGRLCKKLYLIDGTTARREGEEK